MLSHGHPGCESIPLHSLPEALVRAFRVPCSLPIGADVRLLLSICVLVFIHSTVMSCGGLPGAK